MVFAVPKLKTITIPPELTVVEFAVPPLSTYRCPSAFTVVEFTVPPLETNIQPPELTVVEFAMVPECTVAVLTFKINPLNLLDTKVTFAPSSTLT